MDLRSLIFGGSDSTDIPSARGNERTESTEPKPKSNDRKRSRDARQDDHESTERSTLKRKRARGDEEPPSAAADHSTEQKMEQNWMELSAKQVSSLYRFDTNDAHSNRQQAIPVDENNSTETEDKSGLAVSEGHEAISINEINSPTAINEQSRQDTADDRDDSTKAKKIKSPNTPMASPGVSRHHFFTMAPNREDHSRTGEDGNEQEANSDQALMAYIHTRRKQKRKSTRGKRILSFAEMKYRTNVKKNWTRREVDLRSEVGRYNKIFSISENEEDLRSPDTPRSPGISSPGPFRMAVRKYNLGKVPLTDRKIAPSILAAESRAQETEERRRRQADAAALRQQQDEAVDSDEEAQNDVKARLQQASQGSLSANGNEQNNNFDDDGRPLYSLPEMDWWEEGRINPHETSPVLQAYRGELFQSMIKSSKSSAPDKSNDDESLTFFVNPKQKTEPWARSKSRNRCLPHSRVLNGRMKISSSQRRFQHGRNLLLVASRHAFAGRFNHSKLKTSDKIVGMLSRSVLVEDKDLILKQACLQGLRWRMFSKERIYNRRDDAESMLHEFGLTLDRQALGPVKSTGTSLFQPKDFLSDFEKSYIQDQKAVAGKQKKVWRPWPRNSPESENSQAEEAVSTPFIPVPGACPPVPSFPLDAANIVFGPIDRNFYADQRHHVSNSTQRMIASLMLERKIRPQKEETRNESFERNAQIQEYFSKMTKLAADGWPKQFYSSFEFKQYLQTSQPPQVSLFETLALVVSLHASVFLSPLLRTETVKNEEPTSEDSFNQIQDICQSILLEFDSDLDERLQHFPRFFILNGLFRLACIMPTTSSLELLSRDFDDDYCRTPFDLLRMLLEHLDESSSLDEEGGIQSTMLEYKMNEAARMFERAVKSDPTEPLYYAWHIAALSAGMVICSGNRLDSCARAYPSNRKSQASNATFYDSDEDEIMGEKVELLDHEARTKIGKFDELRAAVSDSFGLLLNLAKHQKSCRSHLYVASFLEWKQATALVVGSCMWEEETRSTIRHLHSLHVGEWARSDQSPAAQNFLRRRSSDRNDHLSNLALALENNPRSIANWRYLVETLGPFDGRLVDEENSDSSKSGIGNASLGPYSEPSWIKDHYYLKDDILMTALPAPRTVSQRDSDLILHRAALLLRPLSIFDRATLGVETGDHSVQGDMRELLLPVGVNEEEPAKSDRAKKWDNQLPSNDYMRDRKDDGEPDNLAFFSGTGLNPGGPNSEQIEVLCYKALLLSYFGDDTKSAIRQILDHLLVACWDPDGSSIRSCPEWRGLTWLYKFGVGVIPKAMKTKEKTRKDKTTPKAKKSSKAKKTPEVKKKTPEAKNMALYSEEMQVALIDGLAQFGFGEWSQIQKEYPVFRGHHRRKAEKCYRYLVKEHGMEVHPDDNEKWRRWPGA